VLSSPVGTNRHGQVVATVLSQGLPRYMITTRAVTAKLCGVDIQAPARRCAGSGLKARTAGSGREIMTVADRIVLCQCGHGRDAHRHYRRGSECALCACSRWSPPGRLRRLFRFRIG